MPPAVPNILARQPGEGDYAWRNRRSVALTGETLYQRRIRLGTARGLSVSEARSHGPTAAGTEYEVRRERTLQQYGLTPSQLYYLQIDQQLAAAGYSPASTGLSQTSLRRLWPRIRWINANSSPGGQLTPDLLLETKTDYVDTGLEDRSFVYNHVNSKYESMYEYRAGNPELGRFYWYFESAGDYPVEIRAWWFYH